MCIVYNLGCQTKIQFSEISTSKNGFYSSEECKGVLKCYVQEILTWSVSSAPQPQCVREGRFVSQAPASPETRQDSAVVAATLAVGELSEGNWLSSVSGPGRSLS